MVPLSHGYASLGFGDRWFLSMTFTHTLSPATYLG
jgi:hypothetical protein